MPVEGIGWSCSVRGLSFTISMLPNGTFSKSEPSTEKLDGREAGQEWDSRKRDTSPPARQPAPDFVARLRVSETSTHVPCDWFLGL
jgi:hypothetical protein